MSLQILDLYCACHNFVLEGKINRQSGFGLCHSALQLQEQLRMLGVKCMTAALQGHSKAS